MTRKGLFSREADAVTEEPNDLLIDKVLAYQDKKKEGMSVTADILQQRQELKKDIDTRMSAEPDEPKEEDTGTDESEPDAKDTEKDDSQEAAPEDDKEPADDAEKKTDETKSSDSDEEDHVAASDDVDSLKAMMGSGGEAKSEDDKSKPAAESTRFVKPATRKPTIFNLFTPLKEFSKKLRLKTLSYPFATESDVRASDKHPVVFVKQEVIDSLNELIRFAQSYVDKNKTSIAGATDGAKRLSERLTIYESMHKAGKFNFTNEMVSDRDVLKAVSIPEKSDPSVTGEVLVKYLNESLQVAAKLAKTPIEDIGSAFQTEGFDDKEGVLTYRKTLPGFNNACVSTTNYTNYIDTKYNEYQFYLLNYVRSEELYSLPSISMTDDKTFFSVMKDCNSIITSLGLSVDNLNLINEQYAKFIDDIKAIVYDVEKETRKDLSQLGVDEKMKDFIRFKLMTEIYLTNIDMCVGYLTGVLSVLNIAAKLKE